MNKDKLVAGINNFNKVKVLVIGDLIFDEFIWGQVERISPEAPVPVVWLNSESFMPGGASNVANNIASLGAEVSLCGVVGSDEKGNILREKLAGLGVDTGGIVVDGKRPTTVKTRVIAHSQQVVRIDREDIKPIEQDVVTGIIKYVFEKLKDIDVVVIEDYGKGVINARLLNELVPMCFKYNKLIFVDPKIENFDFYKGVTCITPNKKEAGMGSGIKIQDEDSLKRAGKKLLDDLGCESVLLTLGEDGMCLFQKDGIIEKIPTFARKVFDVSGAGDTVISAFSLSVGAGSSMVEAAHIANYAGGLVVEKVGVDVVRPDELIKRILEDE